MIGRSIKPYRGNSTCHNKPESSLTIDHYSGGLEVEDIAFCLEALGLAEHDPTLLFLRK